MKWMSREVLVGFLVGCCVAGAGTWTYFSKKLNEYALAQLKEAEYASAEAFAAMRPEENGQVQSNYLSYVQSAWESGGIGNREYRRGLTIGLLRYCITLEERGREEVARKACEMSKNEFDRWNPRAVSYSSFREEAVSSDPREYELRYRE